MRLRLTVCVMALAWTGTVATEPYEPTDDAEVVARTPASNTAASARLKRLRDGLERDPENLELAVRIANDYLALGRQQADPRYYGYIQTALAPWWNRPEAPVGVLLIRAATRAAQHDFEAALDDLSAVLRSDPRSAQAWLSRSVVLTVVGRYEEATRSCLSLRTLADHLISDACLANVTSLTGRAAASAELLDGALRTAQSGDPGGRAWALGILADINNRIGRYGEAEHNYLAALAANGPDVQLEAAYADFLIEHKRPDDAVALLTREQSLPDALLLRLALAKRTLGAPDFPACLAELERRFVAVDRRGEDAHLRERARYTLELLDQPTPALELALRNWATQREPVDARLVLEAALAAGMAEAAKPVLVWKTRTSVEDRRLSSLANRLENLP